MNRLAIIFDLDGTLVDTAPDLINTLNVILGEEGLAPMPPASVRPLISEGARQMLRHSFAEAGAPRSEAELEDLVTRFLVHYTANIAVDSRPFPDLLASLERLRTAGHPMGVCTNKREAMSKLVLSQLGMTDYFGAIYGIDTLDVCKPHPGHLLAVLEALDSTPERAVMIGDSETDILTARAAGVPVIGVDFGYSREPVAAFHPDAILSRYADLIDILSNLHPDFQKP